MKLAFNKEAWRKCKKYNFNKLSSYFSIGVSGFRPYQGSWNSDEIYDMEYLRSTFYNRIIRQISESEKKNFLAFCQHHGILTNLVDMNFSLSDLIGNETIENLEQDTSLQKMLIPNLINQASKTFTSPLHKYT